MQANCKFYLLLQFLQYDYTQGAVVEYYLMSEKGFGLLYLADVTPQEFGWSHL